MRVEPYSIGSYLHIIKRGARGMPIVQDEADHRRFLRSLYFMNEEYFTEHWEMEIKEKPFGFRPDHWPRRKPLVSVLAYTLMPNHFHLIIRENREGGVAAFMQKLGQSMTKHFNLKYEQHGSIFQGSYRSRTIDDDDYLRYVAAYVLVKNVFELYPQGGLKKAVNNFEDAWKWACTYSFASLGSYIRGENDPILDIRALQEILLVPREFESFSRDVIEGGKWTMAEFE